MGGIFNINFQATLPAESRLHPVNFAKNPAQVVKLMAKFKQRTATQLPAGRYALSIIRIRTPRWQILPDLTAYGQDPADLILFQQAPESLKRREKPKVVASQQNQSLRTAGCKQRRYAILRGCQRLLDQKMDPHSRQRPGRIQVECGRAGDNCDLRGEVKRLLQARETAIRILWRRIAFLMAQDSYIRMGQQLPSQAQMTLTDAAKAHDEDALNLHRTF
ncbi:MAG: hypothetical protein A2Z93_04165 [Curvibacter sp. GWA2_64_110]|nr:MAG: hypothetical protein A2Z93_04165 [Curvibacter sp. GWA2_64_110]